MLPDSLKSYLDHCKEKQVPVSAVCDQLVKSGWPPDVVTHAKEYYEPSHLTPPAVPHSIPPSTPPSTPPAVSNTVTNLKPPASKVNLSKVLIVVLVIILFVFFGLGTSTYLIANEKISVPASIKNPVTQAYFSIPFVPKNPKYVLTASTLAHKEVSKNKLDISLAISSDDFSQALGTNNLDMQLAGYTDYSDPENPRFSLAANLGKDFNAEARKNDQLIYFKINKLPLLLYAYVGLTPEQVEPLLANWIVYDPTPLDTEARRNLPDSPSSSKTNELVSEATQKLINEKILPNIKMTEENLDGIKVYKLEFAPAPQLFDEIIYDLSQEYQKDNSLRQDTPLVTPNDPPSKYVKQFTTTLWIDTKDYYLRKGTVTFNYVPDEVGSMGSPSPLPLDLTQSGPIAVAFAVKLSDFGQSIPIEIPSQALTPEQFYQQLTQQIPGLTNLGNALPEPELDPELEPR